MSRVDDKKELVQVESSYIATFGNAKSLPVRHPGEGRDLFLKRSLVRRYMAGLWNGRIDPGLRRDDDGTAVNLGSLLPGR
jgi:hypothetical protein